MSQNYKNHIDLKEQLVGNERRNELLNKILEGDAYLPKIITYKDIDESFKSWVENDVQIIDDSNNQFPTMVLFSNQRFSEYTQSWKYTDVNNNLILNFKTVSRENNPQPGKIQNGYWNIPGDNYFTIKKQIVLDDNGSESFLITKMKQPTAIDLIYKVSIFTTQYQYINSFNQKINHLFNSRQCYISPNNHHMPMVLENISDESSYNINDRQFYGQTFEIKVMAYIITEDDYRVDEVPIKTNLISTLTNINNKPEVDVEESTITGKDVVIITFPKNTNKNKITFIMDEYFIVNKIETKNLFKNYKLFLNDVEIEVETPFLLNVNDEIKVVVNKQEKNKEAKLFLFT